MRLSGVDCVSPDEVKNMLIRTGAMMSGHFRLTSGLHSPGYLQCAQVLQYPWLAEKLGRALASQLAQFGSIHIVIGPAIGGIIIVHEVARALGTKAIFAEREAGELRLRRGFSISKGERVVIVEDVITTGGSTLEVANIVKKLGGEVLAVGAIVDRSGGKAKIDWPVLALLEMEISTYPPDNCPLCIEGVPLTKPGSRDS